MPFPDASARPILIYGPTASGKSALALELAEQTRGVVINADALQVYDGWRTLTARPSPADAARAQHRLYGHVPAERRDYSVGQWLRELAAALRDCASAGARPIIVGGTGLYFSKLTQGLAEIPATPPEIRAASATRLDELGREGLFEEIERRDPETAVQLDRRNPRRLTRAWEVLEATGKGLAAWARETPPPLLRAQDCAAARLHPDRDLLAERIERRLWRMTEEGALEEVAAMADRLDDWEAPALKALGAQEFAAHLRGETSLDEAVRLAAAATRQYAKRQRTWGRNQLGDWPAAAASDAAALLRKAI